MRIRSRRRVAGGAVVFGAVLGAASVAWACVPSEPDTTSFNVTPAGGTYGTGTLVTATGTLDKPDWPYHIKLRQGKYDLNKKSDCGDFGTQQVVGPTNGQKYLSITFPLDTVVQASPLGPVDAFFCALPSPNKYTSLLLNTYPVSHGGVLAVNTMYIDTWESKINLTIV